MALPKLNDKPLYSITIPSTGQNVRFRPYLVKEEKILMMAMETKDPRAGVDAIIDTIVSCIDEPIDRKSLKIFDVEYLFIKIRGKSVGEVSKVSMKCKACEELNDVDINLDEIGKTAAEVTGRKVKTVPQIYVDGQYVGGYDELMAFLNQPMTIESGDECRACEG